jgi:hypothetical protein
MRMRLSLKPSLATVALATCLSVSPGAKADGPIFRHAADFFKFNGTEFLTATTATAQSPPGGALFYRKRIVVQSTPPSNTLYVSIYAKSDQHGGAALWLSCLVNGVFCRPSAASFFEGTPPSWIALQKLPRTPGDPTLNCNNGGGGSADCHDNGVAYEWCVPVRPDSIVTVDLRMATSIAGRNVFLEGGHVYIDSSQITQPNRCVEAPPVASAPGSALTAAEAAGEEVAGSTTPGQQQ